MQEIIAEVREAEVAGGCTASAPGYGIHTIAPEPPNPPTP
jgi:hypothetical protein